MRINAMSGIGALAALLLAAGVACAQGTFPNRPVTILVPFAAGGTSDLMTRALADGLSAKWGQPVVVDNRPGGGTMIALAFVARSKPDGYTLASISGSHTVNPAVRSTMPYNYKDLTGVSMFVESPAAIGVNPSFPATNVAELIAEAKKRGPSNPIAFASVGVASSGHMSGELIQHLANITMRHVPYNGSTDALPDVLSGRVPIILTTWADLKGYYEAKTLRIIALMGDARFDEAPEIPTVGETIKGFSAKTFNGIAAPSGTPPEVIAKISADIQAVVASDTFKTRAKQFGSIPWSTTPAETQAFLDSELKKWQEIAKTAGIKLD